MQYKLELALLNNILSFYSVLDQDFQELKSRFGYDYIELQLDFSMDLYPFFPPLVKVSHYYFYRL